MESIALLKVAGIDPVKATLMDTAAEADKLITLAVKLGEDTAV